MPERKCARVKDVGPLGIFASARNPTLKGMVDEYSSARDACRNKGYHEVTQDTKDPLMCIHCDLWFEKDDSESIGIKYKVLEN